MRILSTAWIPGALAEFEAQCALSVHQKAGYQNGQTPFEIFIIDGFDKLTAAFIESNAERGIRFLDATEVASRYVNLYRPLVSALGASQNATYELYCYIRWLVMAELLVGECFLHVDMDLFFQDGLDTVSEIFTGATGTFGSPCLTAISDADWLESYKAALDHLLRDRDGLQAELGYTGNEFRRNISSDQDLIAVLETRGRLPRIGMDKIADAYSVFINPLWPYLTKPLEAQPFKVAKGKDFIGNKPVLFWHLQNNFADYLTRFAILNNYKQNWMGQYLPCRLSLPFMQLAPSAENFAFQALRDYMWPLVAAHVRQGLNIHDLAFEKFFSRTWVSEWFIVEKQGRDLLSAAYWWEDDVFL